MAEEKHHQHHLFHHHKEEKPVEAVAYSDTTYSGGYGGEPAHDYEKERKHHKHLEQLGGLGAVAAGAYALVYFRFCDHCLYN